MESSPVASPDSVAQRDALLELVEATAELLARSAPQARVLLLAECRRCLDAPADQIEALRLARSKDAPVRRG